jgi:hypothetical protein
MLDVTSDNSNKHSASVLLKSIAEGPNGLDVAELLEFTSQFVIVNLASLRTTQSDLQCPLQLLLGH